MTEIVTEMAFVVEGQPVPKQSFKKSAHGRYTPQLQADWQEEVGWAARQSMNQKGFQPANEKQPLCVTLNFILTDKRRRDLDNLSKAVLDACNGILWGDDCQIVSLTITKTIGLIACVEVLVRWESQI
jgi:Holliday junction resolvase RusA-like endonuclease